MTWYYIFITGIGIELSVLAYMIIDMMRGRKKHKKLIQELKELEMKQRIFEAVIAERGRVKHCQNCKALLKLKR